MKRLLLNSTLLILISVTACYGASEEVPDPSSRQKRSLSPVEDLSSKLQWAGEGDIGCLQRQMSTPNNDHISLRFLSGIPVRTCGVDESYLDHQSKRVCGSSEDDSSMSMPGTARSRITPPLPLLQEEKAPLEKATSLEVDSKATASKEIPKARHHRKEKK